MADVSRIILPDNSVYDIIDRRAHLLDEGSGNPALLANGVAGKPFGAIITNVPTVQAGSGDPSPTNIRAITGYTGVTVYVSPTTSSNDAETYNVSWSTEAGKVSQGVLDIANGTLTITMKLLEYDGVTTGKKVTAKGSNTYNFTLTVADGSIFGMTATGWVPSSTITDSGLLLSHFVPVGESTVLGFRVYVNMTTPVPQFRLCFPTGYGVTTVDECNAWLATQYNNGTPVQVLYPLAEPITYTFTPPAIEMLDGQNYVWTSFNTDVQCYYVTPQGWAYEKAIESTLVNAAIAATPTAMGVSF